MCVLTLGGEEIIVQEVRDLERIVLNPVKLSASLFRQDNLPAGVEVAQRLLITFVERTEYHAFVVLLRKNLPRSRFGDKEEEVFVTSQNSWNDRSPSWADKIAMDTEGSEEEEAEEEADKADIVMPPA